MHGDVRFPECLVTSTPTCKFMKIESHDSDIESLLDSSYFYIPRFQRPYSWEDENILDLWDDIISSQSAEYFIGSMVVYKRTSSSSGL